MKKLIAIQGLIEILHLMDNKFKLGPKVIKKPLEKWYYDMLQKELKNTINSTIALKAMTKKDSEKVFVDLEKQVKKIAKELRSLRRDKYATNEDVVNLSNDLRVQLLKMQRNVKSGLELKQFVFDETVPPIEKGAMEKIASMFSSKRKDNVNIYHQGMGEGTFLSSFKNGSKINNTYTFGTDNDILNCEIAKKNGVDFVAKKGTRRMSKRSMDIAIYTMSKFSFFEVSTFSLLSPEVDNFGQFLHRNTVKNGGFIIFNLPYFKIPAFLTRINKLKVEQIYRTDDVAGNLIFITSLRSYDSFEQSKLLNIAHNTPSRLTHYMDATDTFEVNNGEAVHPEDIEFLPVLVEESDIEEDFCDEISSEDEIMTEFEPKERKLKLNRPLQEYKPGHIPAAATSQISNGIYDTSVNGDLWDKKIDIPHMLAFDIVKQEAADMEEELKNGKKIPVVSIKKRNKIVGKVLYPDGKVVEILNV